MSGSDTPPVFQAEQPLGWTRQQAEAIACAAYMVLLRRPPEPGAVAYWSEELLGGRVEPASLLEMFLRSEEFAAHRGQFMEHYVGAVAPPAPLHAVGEPMADIRKRLPDYVHDVILDVGANVGQSCLLYAQAAPEARIHAFEPVPATFAALSAATAEIPAITVHDFALGEQDGTVTMTTQPLSVGNRVQATPNPRATDQGIVMIRRGDSFCREVAIDHVSFLKIDTEGHDLAVLKGFGDLLAKTDFVQVEAAANPHNRLHVPLRDLEDFLRARGFLLFGIYDQTFEFTRGGRPLLRRCNPVFVCGDLARVQKGW